MKISDSLEKPLMSLPSFDELKPFEIQQGGFWDYSGADVNGNGKRWVSSSSLAGAPLSSRISSPPRHRPVEVCAGCGDAWPCEAEKALVAAREAAREALQQSLDAALLVKSVQDVPQEGILRENPGLDAPSVPGLPNHFTHQKGIS